MSQHTMNELPALLEAFAGVVEESIQPVEYRLYYDEAGHVVTMSSSDYPAGDYIVITKEIYDRADYTVRVHDGEIVQADDPTRHHCAIGAGSRFRVAKGHASILVNETYQGETETYGFKNH